MSSFSSEGFNQYKREIEIQDSLKLVEQQEDARLDSLAKIDLSKSIQDKNLVHLKDIESDRRGAKKILDENIDKLNGYSLHFFHDIATTYHHNNLLTARTNRWKNWDVWDAIQGSPTWGNNPVQKGTYKNLNKVTQGKFYPHLETFPAIGGLFTGLSTEDLLKEFKYWDGIVEDALTVAMDTNYDSKWGDYMMGWFAHEKDHTNEEIIQKYKKATELIGRWENYKEQIIRDHKFRHGIHNEGLGKTGDLYKREHIYNIDGDLNSGAMQELEEYFWDSRDSSFGRISVFTESLGEGYTPEKVLSDTRIDYQREGSFNKFTDLEKQDTEHFSDTMKRTYREKFGEEGTFFEDDYDILNKSIKDEHYKGSIFHPSGVYKEDPASKEYEPTIPYITPISSKEDEVKASENLAQLNRDIKGQELNLALNKLDEKDKTKYGTTIMSGYGRIL